MSQPVPHPQPTKAHTSSTVLMVRPASFGFNAETAASNVFANAQDDCATAALDEFDRAVDRLTAAGVDVLVLDDTPDPRRPDAAFPNNWVSFHADGTMVLYPMAAPTRRLERRPADVQALLEASGFPVRQVVDLTEHELSGRFLEGTGSLILDRTRGRAYAALGPRTDAAVIAEFDAAVGCSTHSFDAADRSGRPIYHTNVLLSLGSDFAVVCTGVVPEHQRQALRDELAKSGRTVIEVDYDQLRRFACNIIELRSRSGEPLIALSTTALESFTADQRRTLESFGELIDADIPTIERVGGGSLRCMIADIHLPRR